MPDEKSLTCVDLSAGAGGLAWAFTGFRIVQAVEEDKEEFIRLAQLR